MFIEVKTPDKVNSKVTFLGLSPLVALFGFVGVILLIFVVTNFLGIIGLALLIPISFGLTSVGKKYRDRYKQGEFNYAAKVFTHKSAKKVIVDKDGILEEI